MAGDPTPGQEPARVLLVEDSPTQAMRLQALLEGAGLAVRHVDTAELALDVLGRDLPDAVVLDYHLPGMAGDELCRRLRSGLTTRDLPVLMLTGSETGSLELTGLDSGVDDYLPKSAPADVLLARLRVLLRQRRPAGGQPLAGASLGTARLLVVDDSPTFLELVTTHLRQDGYVVETAPDGEQAIALVLAGGYDGVLVDLVMRGVDGLEVCRRLAAHRRATGTSYVLMVLTTEDAPLAVVQALDAGADDYLVKAADLAVVRGRVRAHLRRRFLHEDQRRILAQLRERELGALRDQADKEAAQARAALADRLEAANRDLEAANRRLRQTQAQLVQSEKLASLGQLTAGIAHELNNPLAFVLSGLDTVTAVVDGLGQQASGLPRDAAAGLDKASRRLADMRQGLERVRDLVVKLRTYSRLDEGAVKTVDLHEGLDAALLFLRHRLGDGVTVVRRYGARAPVTCMPGPLNQVFMNVLANAVDAVAGQGVITVATRQEGAHTFIEVADTGPGIPEDVRPRIFDPFYTTKPPGSGTGLGLAIAYSIVQAHGGDIHAAAPPAGGTSIQIRIPTEMATP